MWTRAKTTIAMLIAGFYLVLLAPGCGPLAEEEGLREAECFEVLEYREIKEVKVGSVSKLRLTVMNTAWVGNVTIPSCGHELWRYKQGAPIAPQFIRESNEPCLKTILTVKPGQEAVIDLPMPEVVWWYQLQLKYQFLGSKILYVPFNTPIGFHDGDNTTPRILAESSVYPADGAIQLDQEDSDPEVAKSVTISGTVAGTIGEPHFGLAIERLGTSERAYYRVEEYCDVDKCAGKLKTDVESSLLAVDLLIAHKRIGAGFVNLEIFPKEGQSGKAKVTLYTRGMQEGMTIPSAESNPWTIQVNLDQ